MHATFVPLHVHTAFSLAEGAIPVKALVKKCAELGLPAVAMTDTNTLAGAVEFSKAAAEAGVQPIIGAQVDVSEDGQIGTLVLLAKDKTGYGSLVRILSGAALGAEDGRTLATLALVLDNAAGLIVLTGGPNGLIDAELRQGRRDTAEATLRRLGDAFGDRLYVEIQRAPGPTAWEGDLLDLAASLDLPLVATNEAFFLTPDMHEAHDALLCISDNTYLAVADRRRVSPDNHLKGATAMAELFADLPQALANTVAIAKRCAFLIEKTKPMLPAYPALNGKTEAEVLRAQAEDGLARRIKALGVASDKIQAYRDRLAFELDVIVKMGFAGYFLIVADFIGWAKQNRIAVGPGRGSGAGSLVAYSLEITNLDPIRYGLLFERFLNPDRVSMPDFDIDFCQERRDEVIAYVRSRYGAERVAQIGTYGKLQARAVVRDVGRVMQAPYPLVDRFCKMIPQNPTAPVTLAEAMTQEPLSTELAKADSSIRKLFDLALKLEGLYRHSSTHAAGVVIADRPVSEIVPVMRDAHGAVVTQFDMKAVEDAGLVKFDFLGLKTLDVIQEAVAIAAANGRSIDFDKVGTEDSATYQLLADGEGFGVFQLESAGMRQAMRQIRPSSIDDIIALVSLYRPGPMENIPAYAAVKHGEKKPAYLHPAMADVLKDTHGVIIYQEQVMEIARRLAGYTLGQADLLRRAMGKKIRSEMEQQRAVFLEGCRKNGIAADTAERIFALLAKFADYGFNKSHAAAYAVIAFQTAYLKRHVPQAFFAAAMDVEINDVDALAAYVGEARKAGVAVLPPDINASSRRFTVEPVKGKLALRYALAAVRGVGIEAMDKLMAERATNGAFRTLDDLVRRTSGFLNRRAIETLIKAGALDGMGKSRAGLLAELEGAVKGGRKKTDQRQTSFFDGLMDTPAAVSAAVPEMPRLAKLQAEHEALGFYFSGHPLDRAKAALARARALSIATLQSGAQRPQGNVRVGAVLSSIKVKTNRKQQAIAIVALSDPSGTTEAVAFADDYERLHGVLAENRAFVFTMGVGERDGERRLFIRDAKPLELEDAA